MACCGGSWVDPDDEEFEVSGPAKRKVKKVSGLALVDIPGVRRRVAIGDVVEVPAGRAQRLVAGGEFEFVEAAKTMGEAAEVAKGDG